MHRPDDRPGIDELLARARAGEHEAQEHLFDRLQARILALAKRRVRDEEAARDVAQETMGTVFEKYRSADLSHGFLPWVFTVLRYKVGNHLKRARVAGRHRVEVDEDWLARTAGRSPEGRRRAFDLRRWLEGALAEASPDCRRIFELLLRGADRHEIRAAFGDLPQGTIDSRISRCRRRLLDAYERGGPSGETES